MGRGLAAPLPQAESSAVEENYPMWVMPVPKLLELNEWKPHQDLVEEGSLKKQNDIPKDSKVVFCSHQWTSFMHPDPEAEQLQALKDLLTKLMQGQTDVRANGALRLKYKQDLKTTGEEWKEMLPKAYVWFDYVSMPQPLAGGGGVHLKSAMASGEAGPGPHAGLSDHRHSANDDDQDLVENLKLAVDSIPSYIERCDYMWVLVPPCKHNDLGEDSVCDFNSWRQRGWCRMEPVSKWRQPSLDDGAP